MSGIYGEGDIQRKASFELYSHTKLWWSTKVLRSLIASLKQLELQNGCQLLLIDMFQPVLTGRAGRQWNAPPFITCLSARLLFFTLNRDVLLVKTQHLDNRCSYWSDWNSIRKTACVDWTALWSIISPHACGLVEGRGAGSGHELYSWRFNGERMSSWAVGRNYNVGVYVTIYFFFF